jgi:hypothetical protein
MRLQRVTCWRRRRWATSAASAAASPAIGPCCYVRQARLWLEIQRFKILDRSIDVDIKPRLRPVVPRLLVSSHGCHCFLELKFFPIELRLLVKELSIPLGTRHARLLSLILAFINNAGNSRLKQATGQWAVTVRSSSSVGRSSQSSQYRHSA